MKVAYMLGSLNRGGTETLLLDTLTNISAINLDAVLLHRKTGSLIKEFQSTRIPVFFLPFHSSFDVGYFFRLRRVLIAQKVTIVHAQLPLDALLAYIAASGTAIRIILSFHGYDFEYGWFLKLILKFIINRTDLNIYVSNHLMQHYRNSYSLSLVDKKQVVVYNGLDFNKFNLPHSESLRIELALPNEILLIGTVGNFVSVRDQFTICHFLKKLQDRNIDFYMIFVGKKDDNNPHLYDNCVNFCISNGLIGKVSFLGLRNDVYSILNQLDAFVYSSDHDTFGIAVVEAIFSKLPVFVNDLEVFREITNSGELAFLYETKNENDLYEKFMLYQLNASKYNKQLDFNSAKVENIYSINNYLHRILTLYIDLST